jgi:hypothetical protein
VVCALREIAEGHIAKGEEKDGQQHQT